MLRKQLIAIQVMFFVTAVMFAQDQLFNNLRTKTFVLHDDTMSIDSLSVIPGSLFISDNSGDTITNLFAIQHYRSKLIKLNDSIAIDTIHLRYRVYPLNFKQTFYNRKNDSLVYKPTSIKAFTTTSEDKEIFSLGGLQKGGSISRGISFGNNQDLSVNSNLNLQLSGKIKDDIEVAAAVTDNNIPIQPDGNTQQLQDFDKVYVQFSKKNTKLLAGDFQIIDQSSKFLKFNKKTQGLSFNTQYNLKKSRSGFTPYHRFEVNAAVSRGKFARNEIIGIEGNQGPYKLSGAENERFIIILSGTERVYIDGRLLTRGQNNDYTIDYNNAEVVFTTNQIITKDKRVVVEFQYSDQNYTRTLFHTKQEIVFQNLSIDIGVYSEQDVKSQQLQQELSDNQKEILSNAGDSLHLALSDNIDSVPFSSNLVLYQKMDSIVDFVSYPVFIYSTNPEEAKYQLGFSDVGQGNGNYVLESSLINGKVFKWVAPVGGIPQGKYEPKTVLISPKTKQMATVGTTWKISEKNYLRTEFAISNNDINTFSNRDKSDDIGTALFVDFGDDRKLSSSSKWKVKTNAGYQLIQTNFTEIERFRDVEFNRDWSIATSEINNDEHFGNLNFNLVGDNKQNVGMGSQFYIIGNDYKGINNKANLNLDSKFGTNVKGNGSWLLSEGEKVNTDFFRHRVDISQQAGYLMFGGHKEQELNKITDAIEDTIRSNSFNYHDFGLFLSSSAKLKNQFKLSGKRRIDARGKDNTLKQSTIADDYSFNYSFLTNRKHQVTLNATYRNLLINDSTLTESETESNFLGKIDYRAKFFKSFLVSNAHYEFASGSEIKREFNYVKVAAGQGYYAWNDYNNDSVQQLNEFEVSTNFPDKAEFIKVFVPTNEFIRTFSTQFSEALNINFGRLFNLNKPTKTKMFFAKFSDQLAYRANLKTDKNSQSQAFLPIAKSVSDTSLITATSSFRNTFFFNRGNPNYSIDYTVSDNQNKTLLTNGFESRQLKSNNVNIRWNFTKLFTLLLKGEQNEKSRFSEFFSNDDYVIASYVINPKLTFQPNNKFRTSLLYTYKDRHNDPNFGTESAFVNTAGLEITYNFTGQGRLDFTFDFININYNSDSDVSSPLQFEMLEGLNAGTNYTWNLIFQKRLPNNMQVNLTYNGRASEKNPPVHTGGVQVQMLF